MLLEPEIISMIEELSQELHEWLEANENADPEVIDAIKRIDDFLNPLDG